MGRLYVICFNEAYANKAYLLAGTRGPDLLAWSRSPTWRLGKRGGITLILLSCLERFLTILEWIAQETQ